MRCLLRSVNDNSKELLFREVLSRQIECFQDSWLVKGEKVSYLTESFFGVLCLISNFCKASIAVMAEGEESIELKFRIFDGTDIGHRTYSPSTTVATLKQRLVAEWPQDKSVIPKSASDMKLIHAGKFLENNKTLSESRIHIGDLPGGVITMHVVVQPPVAKKKTDKNKDEKPNQGTCSCTIL